MKLTDKWRGNPPSRRRSKQLLSKERYELHRGLQKCAGQLALTCAFFRIETVIQETQTCKNAFPPGGRNPGSSRNKLGPSSSSLGHNALGILADTQDSGIVSSFSCLLGWTETRRTFGSGIRSYSMNAFAVRTSLQTVHSKVLLCNHRTRRSDEHALFASVHPQLWDTLARVRRMLVRAQSTLRAHLSWIRKSAFPF